MTRESLPPDRGGIPLAYRLSSSGRRRIHLNAYRSPGLITTRHSLDGVEFVASLVRHDPGLVQLWWPESSRPLRGLATDLKARRSEYEVGSAAWIRLLANGGKEDIGPIWHGVERKTAEPEPVSAAIDAVAEDANDLALDPTATDEVSHAPEAPPVPPNSDEDLLLMFGGELVRLILGAGGKGSRAARAFGLLAERGNADYLLDDLELLCRSGEPEQQLQALRVIRYLLLPADDWYRQWAHELLLRMVDPHNQPASVEAALEALKAYGEAEGSS